MKKSTQYYIFCSIAAVLISGILILGIIQGYLFTNYFTQENEAELGQVVCGVQQGIQSKDIDLEEKGKTEIDYMAKVSGTEIFITNKNGEIIYNTQFPNVNELAMQKIPQEVLSKIKVDEMYTNLGSLEGVYTNKRYTAAIPYNNEKGELEGYIFANNAVWGLRIYVSDMMSSFVFASIIAILISAVLAWIITKKMTDPIHKISKAAKKFGQGDYSQRVSVEGDNELAQLAITFNEMANSFESAESSRRSFMGNIAHELRTPMTTIKGFIDGMLDGTIPEEQQDRYLKIVSEEVGRLARLTHNMLDVTKLEAGEYAINTVNFDIWGPLAQVFINAETRLKEKNITLVGMDGYPPVFVKADQDFVHQIVFNVVDNAIKFTNQDGEIGIHIESKKNIVEISITNTGAEIPEDIIPYIFDRFYKADASRGVNVKGSGLGLHICKVLVGLMGGRIWAESKNECSTFYFTLPAANFKKSKAQQK